jgi:hypothetical protein
VQQRKVKAEQHREKYNAQKKGRRPLHSLALSVPNHHPPPPHTHNPAALTFHRCPPPPHRQISASLLARPPVSTRRSDTSLARALALESPSNSTPIFPRNRSPAGSGLIKHTHSTRARPTARHCSPTSQSTNTGGPSTLTTRSSIGCPKTP